MFLFLLACSAETKLVEWMHGVPTDPELPAATGTPGTGDTAEACTSGPPGITVGPYNPTYGGLDVRAHLVNHTGEYVVGYLRLCLSPNGTTCKLFNQVMAPADEVSFTWELDLVGPYHAWGGAVRQDVAPLGSYALAPEDMHFCWDNCEVRPVPLTSEVDLYVEYDCPQP